MGTMKPTACCLGLLLCVPLLAADTESTLKQNVTVEVVNAHLDPAQPVRGITVSLTYLENAKLMSSPVVDVTGSEGKALLRGSQKIAQHRDLCITVENSGGLVIYDPADGQLGAIPNSAFIHLKLLPKGSPALLGAAQIEKELHRLSLQNKQLSQENRKLNTELKAAQGEERDELTAAIDEWGKNNGFDSERVEGQIKQWAENVERDKGATKEQQGLTEFALKHYEHAAQLLRQAGDAMEQNEDQDLDQMSKMMQEMRQKMLETRQIALHKIINVRFEGAHASQLALKYHEATQTLEEARDRAAKELTREPTDEVLRGMWLEAMARAADVREKEGAFGEAGDSAPLLDQSIKDYEQLLNEYTAPDDRMERASIQNNLGFALTDKGIRSSGTEATDLLARAEKALRESLSVQSQTVEPKDWARTENNLVRALWYRGERSSGTQATDQYAEAVRVFRAALDVQARVDTKEDWATTQANLGSVLRNEAECSSGAHAIDLFEQAAKAFKEALKVQNTEEYRQEFATQENNLGYSLRNQAEWTMPAQAKELLKQAVDAYQAALEVRSGEPSLKQDWAMTQTNFASALVDQAKLSSGTEARGLLSDAVKRYNDALEVYNEKLPQAQPWAQINLAGALLAQGERNSDAQAMELFSEAERNARKALSAYNQKGLPQAWAGAKSRLGNVLMDEAERGSGAQAMGRLEEAAQDYEDAMKVQTRASLPEYWAIDETSLGRVLADEAIRGSGEQTAQLLTQAVEDSRMVLNSFGKTDLPTAWSLAEYNLAGALVEQGKRSRGARAKE
jgi:tetratricopeptide (TPR) repeat protein